MQTSANYVYGPSFCKLPDYNFKEVLLEKIKQEIGSSTQHRVTLIAAGCLTSWPSGCPQLTILPGGGAWPCRHNTNKERGLKDSQLEMQEKNDSNTQNQIA